MTDLAISEPPSAGRSPLPYQLAWGFCYWLVFLLVLEPDNAIKAAPHGLVWTQEIVRILLAAALGASATPVLLALGRRYPVTGPRWPARLGIQLVGSAAMAALLIFISCILADRLLASEHRPFAQALPEELQANWTLLTFAIAGLLSITHAVRQSRASASPVEENKPAYIERVPVKARGLVTIVHLADVDWLEAQGNYVALHTASGVHLVRHSLSQLEGQIDPARFARVHRGAIVAVDRIATVESLGAGDGLLRLKNGTELRLSRSFRDRIAAHIR